MADNPKTILPVLRERSVYVKDDGTGNDNSAYINKSFKGILRLSPNDSASYLEKENYISYNDTTANYIAYEDDITHQLEKQFIRVSSSDGHLLDLRISKEGVEYNNLFVFGATKVLTPIQLYSTDKNSFKIGATSILSERNKEYTDAEHNYDRYVPLNDDTFGDTFILANDGNGMRFINAKQVVNTFIKEALMKMFTLPTGSIHGIPVNIKQYEALLKKSKGHNMDLSGNDSLIRDFLLCDGSYYRSSDFPELAKVLQNEEVHYWNTIVDNSSDKCTALYQEMTEDVNNKKELYLYENIKHNDEGIEVGEPSKIRVFRVPDCRGMFFQSALMGYQAENTVGHFEQDSIKNSAVGIKQGIDNHYHYIALDNPIPSKNTLDGNFEKIIMEPEDYEKAGLIYKEGDFAKMMKDCKPAALTRYGALFSNISTHHQENLGGCTGCCKPCRAFYGSSPIYKPDYRAMNCVVGGPSGGYILSTVNPKDLKNINHSSWLGTSSWPIDMSISRDELINNKNFDNDINYTANENNPIYNGNKKNYVTYDSSMRKLIGYENTPEFYAILPLIKI